MASGVHGPQSAVRSHSELGCVITMEDLAEAQLQRGHARTAALRRVFNGVYVRVGNQDCLELRAQAAIRRAGEDVVLCEVTGLELLGVAIPSRLVYRNGLHLTARTGTVGPRFLGVTAHRSFADRPWSMHNGLPILDPHACWLQVAQRATVDELVVIADSMTRRQNPLTSRDALLAAVDSAKGRRGVRRARDAMMLAVERTDSPAETLTRLALVHSGLPCPEVNFPILDDSNWPMYWLDMAYPEVKLAVEYDGSVHVSDRRQMEWDAARRRYLEDHGWRIITVTAADLKEQVPGFVRSVAAALRDRRP